MKRLGMILLACALILGMSQCKKENTNANVNEDGEKVYIVLKVEDGQRSDVTPSTGVYTYEEGDKLIVGYNGAYCGVLSYNSSNEFSGYITISEDVSQPLYFYYIGEAAGTVSGESYKFDISDQSEGLPVLACAHSSVNYSSGKSNYHAHLRNKCSLVEFSLAEGTSDAVTVGGMHTVASIDFANGTIVATSTTGDITLYSESATSKWAILLPQAEVPNATVTIGTNEGYTAEVPAISANGYFHGTTGSTTAVAIDNTPAGPDYVFSVAADRTVQFSRGNLQYNQNETNKWRFAENQWDYVGDATTGTVYVGEVKSNNASISSTYSGWIDLFGWGTGDDPLKGYDDYSYVGTFVDWGDVCGDPTGHGYTWRTLTSDEWAYLFNTRTGAASKVGYATVNGQKGIIILPDSFTDPMKNNSSGAFVPKASTGYTRNVYAGADWTAMASAGAVFLPAAGERTGTGVSSVGSNGNYWSATPRGESFAYHLRFGGSYVSPSYYGSRFSGYSVRLVR